jgi:hypothetical protein
MTWMSGFARMEVVIVIESLSLDLKNWDLRISLQESFRLLSCNSNICLRGSCAICSRCL